MTTAVAKRSARSSSSSVGGKHDVALLLIILCGLVMIVSLARWMEAHPVPAEVAHMESDELYVTPEAAKSLSLGFNGLAADWYWLRTLQYVGRRMVAYPGEIHLDNLSPLNIKQLAPLLDHATTLDPQFFAAYEYGAMVLPAIDTDAAVRLITKGIAANPQEWKLHHHLGYIHWQRGRFSEASEAYAAGARVANAPSWMGVMSAQMQAKGGNREVARDMYRRMYTESEDQQVKQLALKRLLQVDSLDERDVINRALSQHRMVVGRCAGAWRDVAPLLARVSQMRLDATGAPLDPTNIPYTLDTARCEAALDNRSAIPQK